MEKKLEKQNFWKKKKTFLKEKLKEKSKKLNKILNYIFVCLYLASLIVCVCSIF